MTPSQSCAFVDAKRPVWSVTYRVLESRKPNDEERRKGAKRIIIKWQVLEVSPLSLDKHPGGSGTGTLEADCGARR